MPILNENYSKRDDFPSPEVGTGIDLKILRDYSVNHIRTEDQINQLITLKVRFISITYEVLFSIFNLDQ